MFCGTPCTRSINTWLFKLKIINVTFILTISIWFNPLDLGEEILEVFYPPFRPQQKPQQIEQNIEDDISVPRSGRSGLSLDGKYYLTDMLGQDSGYPT